MSDHVRHTAWPAS